MTMNPDISAKGSKSARPELDEIVRSPKDWRDKGVVYRKVGGRTKA